MKNSEKPAFPISEEMTDRIDSGITIYTGLTKREYAAIMAMQNIDPPNEFYGKKETEESYAKWAKKCVRMADELLKQLEK